MKRLTINIEFQDKEKKLSKTFEISDQMFHFLNIPYQRWGDEVEKYMGDKEDKFYDALYTIQDILLSQFILHKFGIDYYVIEDQGIFPNDIEFDIYIEKED